MKADLVRRNLLSRKDLMLLYRPPIKNSAIPANNPFLTKSILQPRHGKGRNQTIGQSVDQAMAVDHRGGSQRSPRSSTFYSQNDFAAEMITPPNFAVQMGGVNTAQSRKRAEISTRNGGDSHPMSI